MNKRERRARTEDKFTEDVFKFKTAIQILVALAFINTTLILLLPSYLGFSSTSSLSYFVNDGWCTKGQGIGSHCFGDFYYPFNFSNLDAPWAAGPQPIPYPPLNLYIFEIFRIISEITTFSRLSLNIYLVVSVLAMIFPSFHLCRKKMIGKKIALILGAATLMSAPMIASFDRGNLQMLATPLVYLCIFYFITESNKGFLISSCLLVSLKPQFILLGALFIGTHQFKELFKWFSTASLTFLSTFALYPVNVLENISSFLDQIKLFNNYQPAGILFPTNLSISSSTALIYRFFSDHSPESISKASSLFIPIWITAFLFVLVLLIIWRAGPNINRYVLIFIVLCFPILLPGVVFAYHANTLVIFFLFIGVQIYSSLHKPIHQSNSPSHIIQSRINYVFAISIAAFLFIPFVIPWNLIPRYSTLTDGNVTISWTILQLLVQVFFFKLICDLLMKRRTEKR